MSYKTKMFTVWPEEAALLKRADMDQLMNPAAALDLPDRSDRPRAIRIRFPKKLLMLLEEIREDYKQPAIDVLVAAAKRYRIAHPVEPDWEPPIDFEFGGNTCKDLVTKTLFLHEDERALIKELGRGVAGVRHRRAALEALIPIIQQMKPQIPNRKRMKRTSVRLQIPLELHDWIEKQKERGHSYVQVLLAACRVAGDGERVFAEM